MSTPDDILPASEPGPECDREALMRAVADYENAKARAERDAKELSRATQRELVGRLVPILDNLERALEAADPGTDRGLLRGLELVREQIEAVLESYGVAAFESLGATFDPREHEAVALVATADPKLNRKVVRVERSGYRFGDQLLRPARVHVGRLAGGVAVSGSPTPTARC